MTLTLLVLFLTIMIFISVIYEDKYNFEKSNIIACIIKGLQN